MPDSLRYWKGRWDNSHREPDLKIGDLGLGSSLNFKEFRGPKKMRDSFSGPSMIKALIVLNAVQLDLTGDLMKKTPSFPVNLIKYYSSSDKKLSPLKKQPPLEIPLQKKDKKQKRTRIPCKV
ncbi:hypothetical protein O181_078319 [Austropuccinia psidii MF-1]|uniref:Uncharacterized protein n=1 Tax=Austropuccinia psidii MF-1 TaxID=1389203 RepID=A0A9Q3FGB7_9BASI|nr:hypothetical protein [Austropuccinia psidii MF-1]